ncbi:MAG: winged helix-turn-helix domain-containing protein [Acidobacteria bacterium]|nr:winged helix-turn-helix domain-containing protein [Acidobacteriota bacterium]
MRVRFDGFILDTSQMDLRRGGAPVRLAPRAFRLLAFLLAQRPRAVSKRDLVDHIWSGNVVEEANLKTLVAEIRSALEERGGRPEVIRTVYGFGYAFGGEAVEESGPAVQEPLIRVDVQDRVILLTEGRHDIGRLSGCSVFIDAASVSRVHARMHVTRETLLLEDNHSKNGTFLGGARITGATPLPSGSRFRCGDVELVVERIRGAFTETATL